MTVEEVNGSARRADHRRWLAGVAAAVVVAVAAGAGYGIGRSVDSDGESTSGATPATTIGATTIESVPSATTPDSTATTDGETSSSTDTTSPASTETTAPAAAVPDDDVAADVYSPYISDGVGWSPLAGVDVVPLGERRRDDGLVLRAHRSPWWDAPEDPVDSWMPAPWCYPDGEIRLAAASDTIIDVGTAPWYREPFQGRAVAMVLLGMPDGAPFWAIAVQAPEAVTMVDVVAPGGASDSAAPIDGVALLALPAPGTVAELDLGGWGPTFDVVFDGGAGGSLAVSAGQVENVDEETYWEGCEPPPPPLPEAGPQPADPVAAEAAIVELMAALYAETELGSESAFLDDDTGVLAAREAVQAGSFADAASSVEATIEELVFTDPESATFRYRLETTVGRFGDRFGTAVVVDGEWRITRDTFCQDLALAGGPCVSPAVVTE